MAKIKMKKRIKFLFIFTNEYISQSIMKDIRPRRSVFEACQLAKKYSNKIRQTSNIQDNTNPKAKKMKAFEDKETKNKKNVQSKW